MGPYLRKLEVSHGNLRWRSERVGGWGAGMIAGREGGREEGGSVQPHKTCFQTLDVAQCRLKTLPVDFGRFSALTNLKCTYSSTSPHRAFRLHPVLALV